MSKMDSDSSVPVRDIEIFNDIKNYIRRKINNVDNNFFGDDYAVQRLEILKLIRRSVESRESNSVVICGPPGCGKTALLNNVMKELCAEEVINNDTAVVRLNGLLHTDDRLALQDIRRQLKIIESDDKKVFSSFQENLMYFLDKLKQKETEDVTSPCVIFILDEFHLFCEHKNQILLYNLFDIAQSAKAPVCVIGLTFYTDVMDLMEKRVLSRFSHRIIWMVENVKLEDRLKLFGNIFTLHASDLPNIDEIYKFIWNTKTNDLIENKEVQETLKKQLEIDASQTKFRNLLYKLFNTITFELPLLNVESIKSVFAVQDSYASIQSRLSLLEMALILERGKWSMYHRGQWLKQNSIVSSSLASKPASVRKVIRLMLDKYSNPLEQVIAVKHQTVNYEREPFNFEMIYNQYLKFSARNATNLVTERSVVLKAFQRLQELEIILPLRKAAGNGLGKVPLEYQLYNLNLTEEQIAEGVKQNKDLTSELRQWAVFSV